MRSSTIRFGLLAVAALLLIGARPVGEAPAAAAATSELARAHVSPQTGVTDFLRAPAGQVLWSDALGGTAEQRALRFLADRGDALGLADHERANARAAATTGSWPVSSTGSELRVDRVEVDDLGHTHVRFDQYHRGLPVLAGQLFVHLTDAGVHSVNGEFIPDVDVSVTPGVSATKAARIAQVHANGLYTGADDLVAATPELLVMRTGLVEGRAGHNRLAWSVEVAAPDVSEQVYVDAQTGEILLTFTNNQGARNRCTYTPTYQEDNPEAGRVRTEDDGLTRVPGSPTDNLHAFAGQVYDFFFNAFGHDSWDGQGAKMISVYLITSACPNAFWNGTSTNYCPGFDIDDVVAHEWGHAYTETTHALIYAYQSGALNESYSDIWGETIDLLNGEDGVGGSANDEPYPDGVRWMVGEDLTEPAVDLLGLRDMWNPERLGYPAKVSSETYACGTDDQGGVHHNSSVPNHAYAMLVDGKEFNGHTVGSIGLTKAAHIYWRAMTTYQHQSTQFADHAESLLAACDDLIGTELNSLTDGTPSGEVITADDCTQVNEAMLATEMSDDPVQCGFQPLLVVGEPALCPGAETVFSEDWEDGLDGWTLASNGVFPTDWPGFNWEPDDTLPNGRPGTAAYAIDDVRGTCQPGGDYSGNFTMDSPAFSVPADAPNVSMRFNHFMSNEFFWDGGNVKVSVNGGDFQVVPQGNYVFNAPPFLLNGAEEQNLNPLGGEWAFTGIEAEGAEWTTSIIDLAGLVEGGDEVVIRFDFGMDGCNGIEGWYIDEVLVYTCSILEPPTVSLGADYEDPDTDGRFTLDWERPSQAVGPDLVEVSDVAPVALVDDASTLDNWVVAQEGDGPVWEVRTDKPNADVPTFGAVGSPGAVDQSTTLTTVAPITLPADSTSLLRYTDWYSNEGDDAGQVRVSTDGGKSWITVSSRSDSADAAQAQLAFQTEGMEERLVDLTRFAGSDILLQFRYVLGADDRAASTPHGWYVDDIEITVDAFRDLVTVDGTSYEVAAPEGTRWYRARAGYDFDGEAAVGPAGNVVAATSLVDGTAAPAPDPDPIPATGGGAAVLAVAVAALAAVGRRGRRSR